MDTQASVFWRTTQVFKSLCWTRTPIVRKISYSQSGIFNEIIWMFFKRLLQRFRFAFLASRRKTNKQTDWKFCHKLIIWSKASFFKSNERLTSFPYSPRLFSDIRHWIFLELVLNLALNLLQKSAVKPLQLLLCFLLKILSSLSQMAGHWVCVLRTSLRVTKTQNTASS